MSRQETTISYQLHRMVRFLTPESTRASFVAIKIFILIQNKQGFIEHCKSEYPDTSSVSMPAGLDTAWKRRNASPLKIARDHYKPVN